MISGAPSSSSLLRRLFLFIILLYRSLRSDVANLPPSSCTMGRRSGGITGIASIIIHSGLFPEPLNASTTSSLFIILARFCPVDSLSCCLSSTLSPSRSISISSSFTASAPIPTRNLLPCVARASWYSFSDSTCLYLSSVSPGSSTI